MWPCSKLETCQAQMGSSTAATLSEGDPVTEPGCMDGCMLCMLSCRKIQLHLDIMLRIIYYIMIMIICSHCFGNIWPQPVVSSSMRNWGPKMSVVCYLTGNLLGSWTFSTVRGSPLGPLYWFTLFRELWDPVKRPHFSLYQHLTDAFKKETKEA